MSKKFILNIKLGNNGIKLFSESDREDIEEARADAENRMFRQLVALVLGSMNNHKGGPVALPQAIEVTDNEYSCVLTESKKQQEDIAKLRKLAQQAKQEQSDGKTVVDKLVENAIKEKEEKEEKEVESNQS